MAEVKQMNAMTPTEIEQEKQKLLMDMNSLEHAVVWELENWKKNEEAKFKIILKQREFDQLQKLQAENKQREFEREKLFKQHLAQIQLIESKVKAKCSELQKREQKIVLLEEELKSKLNETAKVVKKKEEEAGAAIKKYKDEKLAYEKEKTMLNLKLADQQAQIQSLQDDISRLRKEMENSPIAIVKGDLQKKTQEINELKKEIDKINQIKDQYKQYYERVRDELIRQKKAYEELQQSHHHTAEAELRKLKESLEELKRNQDKEKENVRLNSAKQSTVVENPFTRGMYEEDMRKRPMQMQLQVPQSQQKIQQPTTTALGQSQVNEFETELQRLMRERDYYLRSGDYHPDDPLIQQITHHIQELGGN